MRQMATVIRKIRVHYNIKYIELQIKQVRSNNAMYFLKYTLQYLSKMLEMRNVSNVIYYYSLLYLRADCSTYELL